MSTQKFALCAHRLRFVEMMPLDRGVLKNLHKVRRTSLGMRRQPLRVREGIAAFSYLDAAGFLQLALSVTVRTWVHARPPWESDIGSNPIIGAKRAGFDNADVSSGGLARRD